MNTLTRRRATLLALLVTLLWSTSWVLIKLGLRQSLPPLTFAGLRYMLAFLCLLPLVLFNRTERLQLTRLSGADWAWLVALGLVYYALTQGTQYLSLSYLPAALVSLLLNLTPIVVALGGLLLLGERPARLQWLGLLVTLAGVGLYFYTVALPESGWIGLGVALVCLLANAASAVMGRRVNRSGRLSPLVVTFVSMGAGAVVLLLGGALAQGFGRITGTHVLIIAWLALVNTALAFTLWNVSLRALTAVESSILNGLMLPQIAILAWVFLHESLTPREISGLALVCLGVILVQIKRRAG